LKDYKEAYYTVWILARGGLLEASLISGEQNYYAPEKIWQCRQK